MHILRWFLKHPILLAWALAVLAILLNFSIGGNGEHKADAAVAEQSGETTGVEAQASAGSAATKMVKEESDEQALQTTTAVANEEADEAAAGANAGQAGASAAASQDDLLRAAREAYWSNELDRSIEFYQTLIQQDPARIDYKGELANVFWKQGKSGEAAQLFAEIAPKLAEQGRVTEAFNMKLYVDMVDPELGKKVEASLNK